MGQRNFVEKILSAVAFLFIGIALFIITITPNASGYEISIYGAYPPFFWFFLIASIICGVGIILYHAITEKNSKWWFIGLFIIFFANTIVLLLPELRGYAIYGRGDTLTHLGHIKDILIAGHLSKYNYYPMVHILSTILIQVGGLSLENIPSLIFVLFFGIYLINMYILARNTIKSNGQILFIVALSSPLIYSFYYVTISPSFLSLLILPLLLYLFQKREYIYYGRHKIVILIFLLDFLIIFFHPITTMFFIALLFSFGLAQKLYSRFIKNKISNNFEIIIGKNTLGISLVTMIIFFMWYLLYPLLLGFFKNIYEWIIYSVGTPLYKDLIEPLEKVDLTTIQTFQLFINRYGSIFLLLSISGLSSIYVLIKSISRKHNVNSTEFTYAITFLTSFFIGTTMLFGYFFEYNPIRVFRLPILIGTILSGLVLYDISIGNPKRKAIKTGVSSHPRARIMIVGTIIISMIVLSIGNVFGSNRTYRRNSQVSQMEIVGTKWFERVKNPEIHVIADIPALINGFNNYNFGVVSSYITRSKLAEGTPPHFGYDKQNEIAEVFDFQDGYLIIFQVDKVYQMLFPDNIRPKIHHYSKEDFEKLSSDPTIAKLYCNGEFEIWRIFGNE